MGSDKIPLRRGSLSPEARYSRIPNLCPLLLGLLPLPRTFRGWLYRHSFAVWCLCLIFLLLFLCVSFGLLLFRWRRNPRPAFHPRKSFENPPIHVLPPHPLPNSPSPPNSVSPTERGCYYHDCFDVYRCGRDDHHKIKVYVYPVVDYVAVDGHTPVTPTPMSKEYHEMLSAIYYSEYHTKHPDEACLFVPSVDLLNQNRLLKSEVGRLLATLPFWHRGANHLIFNVLPGLVQDKDSFPDFEIGKAIVAGGSLSTWSVRRDFDVSIPVLNPLVRDYVDARLNVGSASVRGRKWLAISAQVNIHQESRDVLTRLAQDHSDFLVLNRCDDGTRSESFNFTRRCVGGVGGVVRHDFSYPRVLEEATFCVVLRGSRLGQPSLLDAMAAGCIPVVIIDHYVMPFESVIDWQKAAVRLYESELGNLMDILHNFSPERISTMRHQAFFIWSRYLSTPAAVALTTLQIINDRVFPFVAKSDVEWNEAASFPDFFPLVRAPKRAGFTAVILTFDRTAALFKLVQRIAHTDSLAKIVVIWNNQNKRPPPSEDWPKLIKPLVVRETRENVLGNRFYPYEDIETEAVLALDDDINMLTTDELEFAYQVWSEHPDRLVGFPARLHTWDDNSTAWRYESEWMNEISMVLTGAAFYHKHFSYLYTTSMPGDIKNWVDNHMNCEDIAMNFLIANYTGKAPIKVTPRKKFKCPNCPVNSLSYATEHMVERSRCVDYFARLYGRMPLKTVEFRADPALFMDNVPAQMKKYGGIGSL